MNDQTNMTPDTTEQPLKTWVAPTFERTPLNEAMAGPAPITHIDGPGSYS